MALQSQLRCGTLDDIPGLGDDVKRMYQMLKRMESNQSMNSDFDISEEELDSDDEGVDATADGQSDLSKRLEGINLDDADAIWAKLTVAERQEFEKIVQSDDVSNIMPPFSPWWENKVQKVLIQEINNEEHSVEHEYEHSVDHPSIYDSIVDFDTISPKAPAPCVAYNLVNVLAAYTATVRFCMGEHMHNAIEAVNYLMKISANLQTNANFDDQNMAIESVRFESHSAGFSIDVDDVQQMKKDIDFISEGPDPSKQSNVFILAALCDLHRLLIAAKATKKLSHSKQMCPQRQATHASAQCSSNSPEFQRFAKRFGDHKIAEFYDVERPKLNATVKKVEYYLAYAKRFK